MLGKFTLGEPVNFQMGGSSLFVKGNDVERFVLLNDTVWGVTLVLPP